MGSIELSWKKKNEIFTMQERHLPRNLPALLLARMGVHQDYRKCGLGKAMMRKIFATAQELSKKVGFRFIFVDSKPQSAGFYRCFGFVQNNCMKYKGRDIINMTLDLKSMVKS